MPGQPPATIRSRCSRKFLLSALYAGAGDLGQARAELASAVNLQPDNPASWLALGDFDFAHHEPRLAVASLRRAQALDPTDAATALALSQATAAAG